MRATHCTQFKPMPPVGAGDPRRTVSVASISPFGYSRRGDILSDPELMIRMLIVGYCYGVRFERRPCEEVELHLAYVADSIKTIRP
jgi:hypothetical protein